MMDFSIFDLYSEAGGRVTKVHEPYTYQKLPRATPDTPDSVRWDWEDLTPKAAPHQPPVSQSPQPAESRRGDNFESFVPEVYLDSSTQKLPSKVPRKSLYGPQAVWQKLRRCSQSFAESHSYNENLAYWSSYNEMLAKRKTKQLPSDDCKKRLPQVMSQVKVKLKPKHRSLPFSSSYDPKLDLELHRKQSTKELPAERQKTSQPAWQRRQRSVTGIDYHLNVTFATSAESTPSVDTHTGVNASFSQAVKPTKTQHLLTPLPKLFSEQDLTLKVDRRVATPVFVRKHKMRSSL